MRLERSSRLISSFVAFLAALGALSSCTEPKFDATPASITASGNPATAGVVGVPLPTPITVVIKNAGGEPIPEASVAFAVTGGGGSVASGTVLTDTAGKASTSWTLGPTAGTQTATATVTGLAPVTFTVTAAAGAASAMTKSAGDAQTATAGTNVPVAPAVKIADQFGNPVAGVLVTFAVASGGGAVAGASANSGADGIARVASWRLGNTVGSNTLTAAASGLATVTFTATGTVGAAARVQITNTAPVLVVGQTFQLNSRVFDANNNEIANAPVSYSSNNTSVATVNASNGTVTGVGAGTATITASASTGVTATQVITVIGHPSGVLVGTVAGRVGGVAVVSNIAYVAHPFANELAFVDLPTATTSTSLNLVDSPVDVAASRTGTGPIVVPTSAVGGTAYLRLVSPTTRLQIDSIPLSANPVKVAINAAGTRAFVTQNSFALAVIDVTNRTTLTEVSVPGTVVAMKMAPTDSLLYIATRLGLIFEVRASTGAIRRQIQGPSGTVDFDISPDGRTIFIADGTPVVTYQALFTGGMSGSVDFGANVNGVAMTPDGAELWASVPNEVIAAPLQNGEFNTVLTGKRYGLTGSAPGKIVFNQSGSFAAIVDQTNQLIIRR
jgi:hypothetical protein